jgi:hypothetical protein
MGWLAIGRELRGSRLLIEQAEALGEPPEDPLLLFSVLYGFWAANFVAFNGDALRGLAVQFLGLVEKRGPRLLQMIGHRLISWDSSLMYTGNITDGRAYYDRAFALYDPAVVPWRRALVKTWEL